MTVTSARMPTANREHNTPIEHPSLSASMGAGVAHVKTLAASVMLFDPDNVGRAALLGEAISGYLHEES